MLRLVIVHKWQHESYVLFPMHGVASCVVLDHPCSGNSFRYFKKSSFIYHPFVAREKHIEGGRVRKNDKKKIVVMGGER